MAEPTTVQRHTRRWRDIAATVELSAEMDGIRREQQIQFTRIAQLQAQIDIELSDLKRLLKQLGDKTAQRTKGSR